MQGLISSIGSTAGRSFRSRSSSRRTTSTTSSHSAETDPRTSENAKAAVAVERETQAGRNALARSEAWLPLASEGREVSLPLSSLEMDVDGLMSVSRPPSSLAKPASPGSPIFCPLVDERTDGRRSLRSAQSAPSASPVALAPLLSAESKSSMPPACPTSRWARVRASSAKDPAEEAQSQTD
eukprot:scaffold64344_cov27-Tisochrysis_lutea.AAC.1